MEEWPGLSFDEHQYVREDLVPSPAVAGGDDRETYYRVVLMCNEQHSTPDIEETAWRAFTIFGFWQLGNFPGREVHGTTIGY